MNILVIRDTATKIFVSILAFKVIKLHDGLLKWPYIMLAYITMEQQLWLQIIFVEYKIMHLFFVLCFNKSRKLPAALRETMMNVSLSEIHHPK